MPSSFPDSGYWMHQGQTPGKNVGTCHGMSLLQGWPSDLRFTYVTWSPDGTKLAFNGTIISASEAEHIYIINRDGTGLTQITSGKWLYAGPYWVN